MYQKILKGTALSAHFLRGKKLNILYKLKLSSIKCLVGKYFLQTISFAKFWLINTNLMSGMTFSTSKYWPTMQQNNSQMQYHQVDLKGL